MMHKSRDLVWKSIFIALIMIGSTQLSHIAEAQEHEVEFSTQGDMLILSYDGVTPWITTLNLKVFLETNDVQEAMNSRTRVLTDHNEMPTGLAHDNSELYIAYADGTLEIYEKQDGHGGFAHWARESVTSISPSPNSLQLDGSTLLWTSDDSSAVHDIARSTIGTNKPSQGSINISDARLDGGLTGAFVEYSETNQLKIHALDETGSTIVSKNWNSPTLGERAMIRNANTQQLEMSQSSENTNTGVIAISNLKFTDSSDVDHDVKIALDHNSIRVLDNAPGPSRTYLISEDMHSSGMNTSNLPWAWAASSNQGIYASTSIELDQSPLNAASRCNGMVVSFAKLGEFKDTEGKIADNAKVELEIGGIVKTVTHADISDQTIDWEYEDGDDLTPAFCQPSRGTIDFKILKTEPPNLDAYVALTNPGSFQRESDSINWTEGAISWKHNPNYKDGGLASEAITTFGGSLNELTSSRLDTGIIPGNQIVGMSLISVMTEIVPNINQLRGASSKLVDAEPIQSVYSPDRFTQDKNMWWDVEVDWDDSISGLNIGKKETMTVQLLVKGAECSQYGFHLDPTDLLQSHYSPASKFHPGITNVNPTLGRSQFAAELFETWGECRMEFRDAETWQPLSESWGMKVISTDNENSEKPSDSVIRVHVLEFEVPLDEMGEGSAVIPFDNGNPLSHQDIWVRPAEPDSPRYIEGQDGEGLLEWKIIADPDNDANETEQARADNYASQSESTVFFDQEEYSIIVVRTSLEFVECDDWHFWNWNECQDKDSHYLAAPTEESAIGMIGYAHEKMQVMLPIPEGRLRIDLMETTVEVKSEQEETTMDMLGNPLQRTIHTFKVIRKGVEIAEDNGYDRSVMFTNRDASNGDISVGDRMFGFMSFGGICPCSKSVIVGDTNYKSNADTMYHEIGHSILIGHDNRNKADHTLNDCGLASTRSFDYASGWSPVDFSDITFSRDANGQYSWETSSEEIDIYGASFMRYVGDAIDYDSDVYYVDTDNSSDDWPENDDGTVGDGDKTNDHDYIHNGWFYEYDDTDPNNNHYYNWIQGVDYDLAQDTFGVDTGQDFLNKWGELATASMSDYLLDIVLAGILSIYFAGQLAFLLGSTLGWLCSNPVTFVVCVTAAVVGILIALAAVVASIQSIVSNSEDLFGRSDAELDSFYQYNGFLTEEGEVFTTNIDYRPDSQMFYNHTLEDTNYKLLLLDSNGGTLSEYNISTIQNDDIENPNFDQLFAMVPYDSQAVSWEIEGTNQTGLLNPDRGIAVSGLKTGGLLGVTNSNLDFSTGNEVISSGDVFELDWSGTDSMNYDVEATWNGGQNWFPVTIDQDESNITINTDNWPDTDQANIRVVADNGIEESTVSTGEFTVDNRIHRISWISTTDFRPGNDVTLIIDSTDDLTGCKPVAPEGAKLTELVEAGNRMRVSYSLAAPMVPGGAIVSLVCDGYGIEDITNPFTNNVFQGNDESREDEGHLGHDHEGHGHHHVDGDSLLTWGEDCDDGAHIMCGAEADKFGDMDNDGILNLFDQCNYSHQSEEVDQNGCLIDKDLDRDGVPDKWDKCPETTGDVPTDKEGCEVEIKEAVEESGMPGFTAISAMIAVSVALFASNQNKEKRDEEEI